MAYTCTGGVSTTARAKLKSSHSVRDTPQNRPVEIVDPEREKPRNGTQNPCTRPIQKPDRFVNGPLLVESRDPVARMNTPAAANPAATIGKCLNNSSTSPLGYLSRPTMITRSIRNFRPSAKTPVTIVARIKTCKNCRGDICSALPDVPPTSPAAGAA